MAREQRERMLAMVTWITQLEWQMDRQLLMEWRRMKADWYRQTRRRKALNALRQQNVKTVMP
jgi:hypothetical protein